MLCNISISHIHIAYCLPITVSYVMVYCGISKWMISLWQTTSKLTERICTYRNWEHINHYQNWELLFLEMAYTFRIGVANAIKEWTYFQNKDLLQMLLFSFHTYPWNVCVCVIFIYCFSLIYVSMLWIEGDDLITMARTKNGNIFFLCWKHVYMLITHRANKPSEQTLNVHNAFRLSD